jgi:hypothetical protein
MLLKKKKGVCRRLKVKHVHFISAVLLCAQLRVAAKALVMRSLDSLEHNVKLLDLKYQYCHLWLSDILLMLYLFLHKHTELRLIITVIQLMYS